MIMFNSKKKIFFIFFVFLFWVDSLKGMEEWKEKGGQGAQPSDFSLESFDSETMLGLLIPLFFSLNEKEKQKENIQIIQDILREAEILGIGKNVTFSSRLMELSQDLPFETKKEIFGQSHPVYGNSVARNVLDVSEFMASQIDPSREIEEGISSLEESLRECFYKIQELNKRFTQTQEIDDFAGRSGIINEFVNLIEFMRKEWPEERFREIQGANWFRKIFDSMDPLLKAEVISSLQEKQSKEK